jgi:hypothetical protein
MHSADPLRANEAHRMRDLFSVVVERWNALYHDLGGELPVGACRAGQRFLEIGLDATVGLFLTYPDDESNDMLLKVRRFSVVCWHAIKYVFPVKVLDFLISAQNSFLDNIPDPDRQLVSPNSISDASLVPDVSEEFATIVAMHELRPSEMLALSTTCPFMLDRIAHLVRQHLPFMPCTPLMHHARFGCQCRSYHSSPNLRLS